MGQAEAPDTCEICGARWITGAVCGVCGWNRESDRELPQSTPEELELDIAATRRPARRRVAPVVAPTSFRPPPSDRSPWLGLVALVVTVVAVAVPGYLLFPPGEPPPEAAPSPPAADPDPPARVEAPVKDLSAEGSKTGLGLSVVRFVADLRSANLLLARSLGLPSLGAALSAPGLRRPPAAKVAAIRKEVVRLKAEAARLQDVIELRFGLRVGKLTAALGRALEGLEAELDDLARGNGKPEALDRYDQWTHSVLLKLEDELRSRGVPLDQAAPAVPKQGAEPGNGASAAPR